MRRLTLLLLLMVGSAGALAQPKVVFMAPSNHSMPWADFHQGHLQGGILKDLGEALADRMGRQAQFLTLPSRRVREALRAGEADVLCYVIPGWIGDDFGWTLPVLPHAEVIAARVPSPPFTSLQDLAGRRVGTVLGYRYPHLESALGTRFMREDAPDMGANLRKLTAGRTPYAVTESITLRHHLQRHPDPPLQEVWEVERFDVPCALSLRSKLSLDEINKAIQALEHDGSLRRLLARYGS